MSWTEITRIKYRRDGLRYASDTTDEEWTLIEPHMPAKFRVGRPRETRMRAVLDAIFYIIETAPTSASWLNAVDRFFARLSNRRLRRGMFHSLVDLQAAI